MTSSHDIFGTDDELSAKTPSRTRLWLVLLTILVFVLGLFVIQWNRRRPTRELIWEIQRAGGDVSMSRSGSCPDCEIEN